MKPQILTTHYANYYRAQHAEEANRVARVYQRKLSRLKDRLQQKTIGGDLSEAKVVYSGIKGVSTGMFIGVSLGIAVALLQFMTEHGGLIIAQSSMGQFLVGFSFLPVVSGAALGAVIGGMQGAMKGADIHMKKISTIKYN